MKTLICHCNQCRWVRQGQRKATRVVTKQVRANRHLVKTLLKKLPVEVIEDCLPIKTPVDYYA